MQKSKYSKSNVKTFNYAPHTKQQQQQKSILNAKAQNKKLKRHDKTSTTTTAAAANTQDNNVEDIYLMDFIQCTIEPNNR